MARLGELLVRENIINVQQLQEAEADQRRHGGRLGASLVRLGTLDEKDLLGFMSKQYHVPSINLGEFQIDEEVVRLISEEVARKHLVIPVHRAGASLVVAMADPSNIMAIDDIKFLTNYNVEVVVAGESQIETAIEKYYGDQAAPDYEDVMHGFVVVEFVFVRD